MEQTNPLGSLTDVRGLLVGHHQRAAKGWRTGTTVILAPRGTRGGVSVRGAAPGTRETDLLGADTLVQHVDAICLTGGSAYGLDAAGGVMSYLRERRRGFQLGDSAERVVPIVPAAVIFDLGRAGHFENHPDALFGDRACRRASSNVAVGSVGAGTGARAGGLQGGVGTASRTTVDGHVVAALAVVNSIGSPIDPATGRPWFVGRWDVGTPSATGLKKLRSILTSPGESSLNTTIGVVATDAPLPKAWCSKMADVAHDGLARAIRPAHSMNDGDCVFALATGHSDIGLHDSDRSMSVQSFNHVLSLAADVFAEACTGAVLAATDMGGYPAYRDFLTRRRPVGPG